MAIGTISNGEAGSSVRTKLNQTISAINGSFGGITATDSTLTSGAPLNVSAGTTVALTNDNSGGITSYLPSDSNGMYDGGRLVGDDVGDQYELRITLNAYTNNQNGGFNILIDISAAGDGSVPIVTYPVRLFRGTGAANVQQYTVNIPYFTLGTFIANGGKVLVESITGTTSIYGVSYYIKKVSSGAL